MPERPADPLTPPSDPWAGSAPVIPPTSVMGNAEPYVVVVERARPRRWPWVIGALAALSVLGCVGALVVWSPIGREHPAYLEVSDPVAGLSRVDNPDFRRASAEYVAEMYRDHDVDDAVATVLTDPTRDGHLVMLIGATKLILNPAGDLDRAIRGATRGRLRDLTSYPELGGRIACGNAVDDANKPIVVCAWMDHGSIGLGFYYGPWRMDECAAKLRDIRDAIVRRGERP